MSNQKGAASRRVRPASTAREALGRWGLKGFTGKAVRGKLDAFTGEHFEADVRKKIIRTTAPILGDRLPRGCPAGRPERHCQLGPAYYLTHWHQIVTLPPVKPTKADPDPRPRRKRTGRKLICYDCRSSLWQQDRRAFAAEFGTYELEQAEIHFKTTKISGDDVREAVECESVVLLNTMFQEERRQLVALVGESAPLFSSRGEQMTLLSAARHALRQFAQAVRRLPIPAAA